jgi:hypothetical protein
MFDNILLNVVQFVGLDQSADGSVDCIREEFK